MLTQNYFALKEEEKAGQVTYREIEILIQIVVEKKKDDQRGIHVCGRSRGNDKKLKLRVNLQCPLRRARAVQSLQHQAYWPF